MEEESFFNDTEKNFNKNMKGLIRNNLVEELFKCIEDNYYDIVCTFKYRQFRRTLDRKIISFSKSIVEGERYLAYRFQWMGKDELCAEEKSWCSIKKYMEYYPGTMNRKYEPCYVRRPVPFEMFDFEPHHIFDIILPGDDPNAHLQHQRKPRDNGFDIFPQLEDLEN